MCDCTAGDDLGTRGQLTMLANSVELLLKTNKDSLASGWKWAPLRCFCMNHQEQPQGKFSCRWPEPPRSKLVESYSGFQTGYQKKICWTDLLVWCGGSWPVCRAQTSTARTWSGMAPGPGEPSGTIQHLHLLCCAGERQSRASLFSCSAQLFLFSGVELKVAPSGEPSVGAEMMFEM